MGAGDTYASRQCKLGRRYLQDLQALCKLCRNLSLCQGRDGAHLLSAGFLVDSWVCISCNRREKSFLSAQTLKSRHRKRDIWASCQQASWATRLTCPGFFSILTMSQSSARVGHTVMCRFCVKLCLWCVAINLDYVCCVWGFINYLPYWRNSRYE